jgi:AcrR family transcriptional regulator
VHQAKSAPGGRRYAARLPASERREQLLEVAMDVVIEHGYAGLTMEAVARRAGVTKPVVYDAFANRDDVMRTLLAAEERRAVAEILDAIGPIPSAGGQPADAGTFIVEAVGRVLRAIAARPRTYELILLQIEGTPALVRERIDAGRAIVVTRVREVLAWAARSPDGTTAIDAELLALAVVALGEHAAVLVLAEPERFTPERFDASLRQLLAACLPALERPR